MRWTRSRDGRARVTVRASYRLDAENLADILCYRALSFGWDLDGNPSLAYLEDQVRETLASSGMAAWPYWRDEIPDEEADGVLAWAQHQVTRLGGRLRETGGES